jgi:hypothetical protein
VTTIIAASSALGGVLLHLIGATTNQTYFSQWGLDSEMFPQPTDLTIVLGYHALWNGLASTFLDAIRQYWLWLVGYGFFVGLIALLALLPDRVPRRMLATWLEDHQILAKIVLVLTVSMGSVAVAIPALLVTALVVLALPIGAGESYGKKLVSEQLTDYRRGCENPTSHAKCTALMRGNELVAQGFLIASTEAHVAIYDPVNNRTILTERAGLTLRGAPNWLAYPPDWKASDIK